MINFEERVKGMTIGIAYGDALGATIEKLSYNEIREKFKVVDDLRVDWWKSQWTKEDRGNKTRGNGIVTDDTLMTLALMRVYNNLKRHIDAYDLSNEFIKEIAFRKYYIPEFEREGLIIDRLFYPDKYMFIRHTLANCDPRQGGIGNMVNCGAAMYIAPVGAVNACNPRRAYEEAIGFAQGHQCSYGLEAAGVLSACVAKSFIPDTSIEDVVDTGIAFAKDGTKKAIYDVCDLAIELRGNRDDREKVVKAFHQALIPYSPMGDDVGRSIEKVGLASNHYTPSRIFSIEELPIALGYALLHEDDFHRAVVDGVNSGRDTDSIGVMIGSIHGAMKGSEIVKDKDIELLEDVNRLELIKNAEIFTRTAKDIVDSDIDYVMDVINHVRRIY